MLGAGVHHAQSVYAGPQLDDFAVEHIEFEPRLRAQGEGCGRGEPVTCQEPRCYCALSCSGPGA